MDQARSWDLAVNYTGPPVMPYLTFAGDQDHELAGVFAAQALRGGAYLHPRHNWFVSAAMTGDDLALVLEATDQAFAAVRKHLGQLAGYGPGPWPRSRYFGGLLWRLKQGPRRVFKPVEDLRAQGPASDGGRLLRRSHRIDPADLAEPCEVAVVQSTPPDRVRRRARRGEHR